MPVWTPTTFASLRQEQGKRELEVEFISWLRAMCQPELRAMRAGFAGVSILEVDPDIEAAYYDLRFADEAIPQVKDPRRKGLLARALEEAMLRWT